MKKTGKILIVALCIAMVFTLAACGSDDNASSSSGTASPSASASAGESSAVDNSTVIAKVNDNEITYGEYTNFMNNILANSYVTMEQMDEAYGVSLANEYREKGLDIMINQEVMLIHAKESGFDQVSDEEKADIQESVDSYFTNLKNSIRENVSSSLNSSSGDSEASPSPATSEEIEAETQKQYDAYLEEQGYSEEYVYNFYLEDYLLNKVYEEITKNVTASDEELQEYYDTNLAAQQDLAKSNPATAIKNYVTSGANAVNLYIPEGFRYVKHILIQIPTDKQTEISSLQKEGKDDEAEALRQAELEKLKPEADEALKKAKDGENFDTLVETYGDDPGMKAEPYKTQGYPVYEDSTLEPNFEAAGLALKKVGDISGLVETSYGYHILQYTSQPTSSAIPFDDVKTDIQSIVLQEKYGQTYESTVKGWREKCEVVKYDELYLTPEEDEDASASPSASDSAGTEPSTSPSASAKPSNSASPSASAAPSDSASVSPSDSASTSASASPSASK